MKDGTYIESEFDEDRPIGKILVIKPNGTYFEGKIGDSSDRNKGSNSGILSGIFRNPVLKRQSINQKNPERSKIMNFGKNCFGYSYMKDARFKGFLGKGELF